jgi:hypothetical protein
MIFRALLQASEELARVFEHVQPVHLVVAVVALVFVAFVVRMWVNAQ